MNSDKNHGKENAGGIPNVVALIGPTASGKTAISIELAKLFNAEIISCDSRQIYKLMDIGTAKPNTEEMQGIRHHLIDIIYPDSSFSYADFASCAAPIIKEILGRGKVPFIVGGTGFYLDGLVNGVSAIPEVGENKLKNLREELELLETAKLVSMLNKLDPESAARIKFNDRQRLVRAISVSELTGRPFSSFKDKKIINNNYNYLIIGLTKARELLYNSINLRVEVMFKNGLLNEVESLLNSGYGELAPGMKTIGYQECVEFFYGRKTKDEAMAMIKQNTRNYAKRQETYFKRFKIDNWFNKDENKSNDKKIFERMARLIENHIK